MIASWWPWRRGEIDGDDMRIAPHQVGHDRPGAIARAVVEEDEFVVGTGGRLRRRGHAAIKLLEPRFLVIAGRDDGEPRTDARIQNHRHHLLYPAAPGLGVTSRTGGVNGSDLKRKSCRADTVNPRSC